MLMKLWDLALVDIAALSQNEHLTNKTVHLKKRVVHLMEPLFLYVIKTLLFLFLQKERSQLQVTKVEILGVTAIL